ncbi:MAG: hypothetical protein AAF628_08295 [Planctomycetota bacterium]
MLEWIALLILTPIILVAVAYGLLVGWVLVGMLVGLWANWKGKPDA